MNISQSAEGSTGMARIARLVVPALPHHVTQRGNRREPVFFEADDYRPYRRLPAGAPRRYTSLGLLSDAQSRPLGVRRRKRMGRGRSLPRRAGTIPRR
jgi:hypothetical protein